MRSEEDVVLAAEALSTVQLVGSGDLNVMTGGSTRMDMGRMMMTADWNEDISMAAAGGTAAAIAAASSPDVDGGGLDGAGAGLGGARPRRRRRRRGR